MIVNTEHDGWECCPALQEVVDTLANTHSIVYEINNCVRAQTTEEIVNDLRDALNEAISQLDDIDESVEYNTVDQ